MSLNPCIVCGIPSQSVPIIPMPMAGELFSHGDNVLPICVKHLRKWMTVSPDVMYIGAHLLVQGKFEVVKPWGISKPPPRWKWGDDISPSLETVFQRDKGRCRSNGCGKIVSMERTGQAKREHYHAERGHILSRRMADEADIHRGIKNGADNMVLMCNECNQRMGSDSPTLKQGMSYLLKPWIRPTVTDRKLLKTEGYGLHVANG